ncbi:DMT family transporter [Jannaschia aquimarina]|uniref:RibN_4 protein n=1 Tax=Jannaschia aquimarina TaxID=935700 RepID=A0A0D1EJF3_9RHOB|nr:DMT family transporter [Jannaschia aquimarina]KIT15930.1 Riboflavin transporter [Jannaschia aquimarina]SNS98063.1 Permease of the drug/metabolite transporter (DMT) superfamily [Jannaschia aquimarina]
MDRTTLVAATWMLGSIVSFTSMAVAGRAVSDTHDTFEIMLFRSVIGLGIVLSVAGLTGRLREVSAARLPLHVTRNIAHFAGQNLWFYALTLIPLAQVFALEFTSPLWVLVLAPLIVGERVRPVQYVIAALGFAGVLIVARPFSGELSVGLLWAGMAALFFALTNLLTRRLTRHDGIVTILFWLTALQLLFGLVCAGWDGDIALPDAATAPWLALIGLAGLTAHFCLTKALSQAPASTVMPVDFARLPIIALIGAAFYAEPLDPMVLLGGTIIAGAAYANLRVAARPLLPESHRPHGE